MFTRTNVRRHALERAAQFNEYLNALIRLPAAVSESKFVAEVRLSSTAMTRCTLVYTGLHGMLMSGFQFFETRPSDIAPAASSPSEKSADAAPAEPVVSGPLTLAMHTAMANYKPAQKTELALAKGDAVEVIEKNNNGWWFARCGDRQGWIPATCVNAAGGFFYIHPHLFYIFGGVGLKNNTNPLSSSLVIWQKTARARPTMTMGAKPTAKIPWRHLLANYTFPQLNTKLGSVTKYLSAAASWFKFSSGTWRGGGVSVCKAGKVGGRLPFSLNTRYFFFNNGHRVLSSLSDLLFSAGPSRRTWGYQRYLGGRSSCRKGRGDCGFWGSCGAAPSPS